MVRRRSEVRPAATIDLRVRLVKNPATLTTVVLPDGMKSYRPSTIVKVVPERGMPAGARQAFIEACKAAGAVHVWVAPARGGDKAVGSTALVATPRAVETVKEAIQWLLDHAVSADPEKLATVVEDALAKASL